MIPWKGVSCWFVSLILIACLAHSARAQEVQQQNQWESLMAAGATAFQQRSLPEAEKQYQAAMVAAEKFGSKDERLATSLERLALVHIAYVPVDRLTSSLSGVVVGLQQDKDKERFVQAERLLKRALKIREAVLRSEHPGLLKTLLFLSHASFWAESGGYASERYLRRALAIREKVPTAEPMPEDPILFAILAYRCHGLARLADYKQAEGYYLRALALREKTLGPEHSDVADDLEALADLYMAWEKKGLQGSAGKMYERGPGPIVKNTTDPSKGRQPQPYELGISDTRSPNTRPGWYRDLKQNAARAQPFFERAAAIREKVLRPEHPKYITTLVDLTTSYAIQKKDKEAAATAQKMWEILQRAPNQPQEILLGAAGAMRSVGRNEEAAKLEARAGSMASKPEK